jgi:inorganic pyrophosphatase
MKANFILPFDPITRQTTLPLVDDRPIDFCHLTKEQGNTVVVQVQADDAIIAAMKADPTYQWLEDIEEVQDAKIV